MAARSKRLFLARWCQATGWCLLLAGGVALPALAVRAQDSPQIEMWQGNKPRGGERPAQATPTTGTQQPLTTAPASSLRPLPSSEDVRVLPPLHLRPIGSETLRIEPPPPLSGQQFKSAPAELPAWQASETVKPLPRAPVEPALPLSSWCQDVHRAGGWFVNGSNSVLQLCSTVLAAERNGARIDFAPESPIPTAKVTAPGTGVETAAAPNLMPALNANPLPLAQSAEKPQVAVAESGLPWHQVLWLQVPLLVGVLVAFPLVVALALALVLRRSGMRFRVELVNSSSGQLVLGSSRIEAAPCSPPPPGQALSPEDMERLTQAAMELPAAPGLPEHLSENYDPVAVPEQFELGASYEEEQKFKAEALLQQEMAVLQQVFEENLQLQEEIQRLSDDGEVEEQWPAQ